jgi:hypothetical protein
MLSWTASSQLHDDYDYDDDDNDDDDDDDDNDDDDDETLNSTEAHNLHYCNTGAY